MRESEFCIPTSNKAVISITPNWYDRRALDTRSNYALYSSLSHLANLCQTSPKVRESLACDGGLEQLIRILKQGKLCRVPDVFQLSKWQQSLLCVVNIGVRGSESVRTRVIEAGVVPVAITILCNALEHIINYHRSAAEVTRSLRHGDDLMRESRSNVRVSHSNGRVERLRSDEVISVSSDRSNEQRNPSPVTLTRHESNQSSRHENETARRLQAETMTIRRGSGSLLQQDPSGGPTHDIPLRRSRRPAMPSAFIAQSQHRQQSRYLTPYTDSDTNDSDETQSSTNPILMQRTDQPPHQMDSELRSPPRVSDNHSRIHDDPNTSNLGSLRSLGLSMSPNGPSSAAQAESGLPHVVTYTVTNPSNRKPTTWDQDVILCLRLLAYLSKYSHLRLEFSKSYDVPRLRQNLKQFEMHYNSSFRGVFEQMNEELSDALQIPFNVFHLVEKFTMRIHAQESTYWAGVIMRNSCRRHEQGGIRQCAYLECGIWETQNRQFAKCRRCRRTKYCSKACQSKAWIGHRYWCSSSSLPPESS